MQVTADVQKGTAAQAGHVSAGPALSSRYRPLAQLVHCEVVALVHVMGEVHESIDEHVGHAAPEGAR